MTRLALAMAAAFVLPAACAPAYAAAPGGPPPLCAPLAAHASYLARRWGERPVAPGRIGRKAAVVLFVNPSRRTWTLIRIMGGGLGCAVGAGRLPEETPPAPAPIPRAKPSVL